VRDGQLPVSASRQVATFAAAAALLFAVSCASLPGGTGGEPGIIAIRNRSGEDIETVTLREQSRFASDRVRFGSISPVPSGSTQIMGRPSKSRALPKVISVEWMDGGGKDHVKELPLSGVLGSAKGGRDEALLFEFGPSGDVRVLIETLQE
jgi:hypothetical protein